MNQKKRPILKAPYILATPAGKLWIKIVYMLCFASLALSFLVPFYGAIVACSSSIVIWQVLKLKDNTLCYTIYNQFLLQRTIFYSIFSFILMVYCSIDGFFNQHVWSAIASVFIFLGASDIVLIAKGLPGIGFINAKKI